MYKKIILSLLINSFIFSQTIFFSEYAEGSSNNKYLEIYNNTDQTIDLSQYAFPNSNNGADIDGTYDYWNTFDDGASVAPSDVYVICHGSADDIIQAECDQNFKYLSNGDDVFAITEVSNGTIIDIIGTIGDDPGNGWEVAGIADGTKDHTMVRKSTVQSGNYGDWFLSTARTDVCSTKMV